ncbi:hypothetical protein [Paenibacillus sp. QZ-Y1]|uniref:hypothetical protein n=1 Tax=Paenibacillus sp. QZ-Y1 TaxID=3414511 RepID=UPI003F794426
MHSIESLEAAIAMIPMFKAAVPAELSIAICDTEKFLAYWPGENIDLRIASRGAFDAGNSKQRSSASGSTF